MAETPTKSFDVAAGGSQDLKFRAHPRYDAVRVDFDSSNSASADTDVTVKVDSDDELDNVTFASADATVLSDTGNDVSSGDPSIGTEALARTIVVQINEQGTTDGAEGTVSLHPTNDPAQNGAAFANR